MRNTTITIDQHALAHNLQVIKQHLKPATKVLAMVKADAYGHGIKATLPALMAADGFGVACMSEALAIKALGNQKPVVLIEGVFSQAEWQTALAHDFGCVIHQIEQLNWALSLTPDDDAFGRTIWLKYNTGMSRLGFGDDAIIEAARQLNDAGYRLILTSHFACADEQSHPMNARQILKFNQVLDLIRQFAPQTLASLCNSAGIINFADQQHDWVRAGIALYGSKPVADQSAHELGLKPAMTLSSQVMALHTLADQDCVGYSALWMATKAHQIAVVAIGYGDGYPRVVSSAKVSITDAHGKVHQREIIGRVAMDMLMIDVDGLDIDIGAPVVLWGASPSIDEVASCAGTIGYELMCRLTQRPKRRIVSIDQPTSSQN